VQGCPHSRALRARLPPPNPCSHTPVEVEPWMNVSGACCARMGEALLRAPASVLFEGWWLATHATISLG
jgi:hypothetical protein